MKPTIPSLSFVRANKPEYVRHSKNVHSEVISNILCNGVRIGIIWKESHTGGGYVVWYHLSATDAKRYDYAYLAEGPTLRSARNKATHGLRKQIAGVLALVHKNEVYASLDIPKGVISD